MSQRVDKTGSRTLAVVTKVDKAPEGLLEKVTADDVNIGLGYVCVRNRIGDESYEEARIEEAKLFDTHPLLSKIDKSLVSIPVLAQKLAEMLNQYSVELQKSAENDSSEKFLMEEITVLEEAKGIGLPNFLPRTAFLTILQTKVKSISGTPIDFVAKVCDEP
ncbi:hypothetical protein F0562_025677 [Nyssa sinensis]|uniref:Dynamin-type G domain-containing protein n=1 Tax=Nyssa sinensis TaxID=561372 RepID=A0A5J5B6Z1_9ASTE|nr:hypothetical protein F0562_025677 [Nyssa sinensis]